MSEYIITTHDEPDIDGSYRLTKPAEEIVRCMDCVWFKNSSYYGAYCTNFGSPLGDDYDGFCSWGERREQ